MEKAMENVGVGVGIGAGLAALAFWGFIAAVVVAYYWDSIRKRDAQHETVRRALESGQQLDQGEPGVYGFLHGNLLACELRSSGGQ